MNISSDIDDTLAIIDADRIANEQKLSTTLSTSMNKILNDHAHKNFLILKEAKMAVHRCQLTIVRKNKIIKGLQKSLRNATTEVKAMKKRLKQCVETNNETKEPESEEIELIETKQAVSEEQLKAEISKLKEQLNKYEQSNAKKSKKIMQFKILLRDHKDFEGNQYSDSQSDNEGDEKHIVAEKIDVAALMDPDSDEEHGNDPEDPEFDIAEESENMEDSCDEDSDDTSEQMASQTVESQKEDDEIAKEDVDSDADI